MYVLWKQFKLVKRRNNFRLKIFRAEPAIFCGKCYLNVNNILTSKLDVLWHVDSAYHYH